MMMLIQEKLTQNRKAKIERYIRKGMIRGSDGKGAAV
jgi:hypothetical protein